MGREQKLYSKTNLEKDSLPKKERIKVEDNSIQLFLDNVASDYLKTSKELIAKAFFVIISGGEVREKDYFTILSRHDNFKRIKIEFIADPNQLSPKGMLNLAKYKKEHFLSSQQINTENPDRIYLISDVDEYMGELLEIKPECKKEQLHLIISNSCFEVWLYYACRSTTPTFPIPEKIETISWKFKEWLPTIIKGGINPTKAVFNIHQNIESAKANYKEDAHGIPELFSTNMFELANDLLPLIEPELLNLIEKNKVTESKFRKKSKK
jgi:hypothetical protein